MRIGTGYQWDRLQSSIQRAGTAYSDAQIRASSGRRLNTLSDDPMGLNAVVQMRSLKSSLTQYGTNLLRATNTFAAMENALGESSTLLSRANQLAISGATASSTPDQRRAMADEVKTIKDQLVRLANTKGPNGDHIFAGQRTNTAPFTDLGTGIEYRGDSNPIFIESGPGERMNLSLSQAPGMFLETFEFLDDLQQKLSSDDLVGLSGSSISQAQKQIEQINLARAEIGSRTRTVSNLRGDHERRILDLTQGISDLEEVDLSQAITDLKKAETAYQAALQVTSNGSRLSLLEYLR